MDGQLVVAGAVAGLVATFFQETVFGGRVTGRAAALLAAAIAFVFGLGTTWATGGLAGAASGPAFDLLDPRAFLGFWGTVFAPVFASSQFFYAITTKRSDAPPPTGIIQSVAKAIQPVIGLAQDDDSQVA